MRKETSGEAGIIPGNKRRAALDKAALGTVWDLPIWRSAPVRRSSVRLQWIIGRRSLLLRLLGRGLAELGLLDDDGGGLGG